MQFNYEKVNENVSFHFSSEADFPFNFDSKDSSESESELSLTISASSSLSIKPSGLLVSKGSIIPPFPVPRGLRVSLSFTISISKTSENLSTKV